MQVVTQSRNVQIFLGNKRAFQKLPNFFAIPGDPQKSTPFLCEFLEPLISLKKCSISKVNILISVFICTKSKISRLNFAGDTEHIRNIFPVFYS